MAVMRHTHQHVTVDSGVHEALPGDAELDTAGEVLKLLSDRTRLAIVVMLDGREMTVSAIAEMLDRPVPAISQHLAKLRGGGLVTSRRQGPTVRYMQPDEHIAELVANILQFAEHRLYPDQPPHHAVSPRLLGRGRGTGADPVHDRPEESGQ